MSLSLSSTTKSTVADDGDDDVQEALPQLVERLRKKIALKEKSYALDKTRIDEQIKLNWEKILQLREKNNVKHQLLAECEKADEYVIKQVFSTNDEERKALMHMNADRVIYYMNERVCSIENTRNLLDYDVKKRQKMLAELHIKLDQLNAMRASVYDDGIVEMTKLENDTDKARMKYETATTLTRKYRAIIDKLKGESVSYMSKLDTLENALLCEQKELEEMEKLCKTAEKERDEMKAKYAEMEKQMSEVKARCEEEMSKAQKLESNLRQAQQHDNHKHKLISSSSGTGYPVGWGGNEHKAEEQDVQDTKERLIYCEQLFMKLLEVTQVTKLDEVLPRVHQQAELSQELREKVKQLEHARDVLREEVNDLQEVYHGLKYSQQGRMSSGQRMLEDCQQRVDVQQNELDNQRQLLASNSTLLLAAHRGIRCMLDKLENIHLKPPKHNFKRDDIFYNIDLLNDKLCELEKQVSEAFPSITSARDRYHQLLKTDDFIDFLEKRIQPDNVRVDFKPIVDNRTADFDYDGTEHSSYLDRNDIKTLGQKILETKSKQPRRKRGRKT